MNILLVCGYRRTGKDTLYQTLIGESDYKWNIYQHKDRKIDEPFPLSSYTRVSFADPLKSEASEVYGIPEYVPDSDKDLKQFIHYCTGELVSARDIYIEWGKYRRFQDPNYWCKQALKSISNENSSSIVITDWRFINEGEFFLQNYENVLTIRIYRSDVLEPDINIESEHQLDTRATDLLITSTSTDFDSVVVRFPQYKDYVLTHIL